MTRNDLIDRITRLKGIDRALAAEIVELVEQFYGLASDDEWTPEVAAIQ